MKLLFSLIAFVMISTGSSAQEIPKNESTDAIKKLSFLVGNWQGSGWFKFNEVKDSLAITQAVTIIDSGTVFQMNMTSEILSNNTKINTDVLVWYDATNKVLLTSATSMGRTTNGQAIIADDHSLQCRFVASNGTEFRYTYSVINNSETILGEMTSDNGTIWTDIFGGMLTK